MKHIKHNQRGFTIVETLVAITILMIAIAGPLTVANKAYTAALDARNQTIASNLAQEALEYINAVKDNVGPGSIDLASYMVTSCTWSDPCGVSPLQQDTPLDGYTSNIMKCTVNIMNGCRITSHITDGYSHETGNGYVQTNFERRFYILPVISFAAGGGGVESDEVKAEVEVRWKTGTRSNTFVLRQILTGYRRGL